jgi:hypothetical protein
VVGGIDDTANGGPIAVHRLLPNGSTDTTFHTSDILFKNSIAYPMGGGLALSPDGDIVVATNLPYGPPSYVGVLRLDGSLSPVVVPTPIPAPLPSRSPGALDANFGVQGRTVFDDPSAISLPDSVQEQINATAVQPDGKIVLAGSIGSISNQRKGQYFLEPRPSDQLLSPRRC